MRISPCLLSMDSFKRCSDVNESLVRLVSLVNVNCSTINYGDRTSRCCPVVVPLLSRCCVVVPLLSRCCPVVVVCITEVYERCVDLLLPSVLIHCSRLCVPSVSDTTPENRPEIWILPVLRRTRKTLPSLSCNEVAYHIVSFLIPNPKHTVSLYTFIYQESSWLGRSGLVYF